jgi:hypothetical protein
MPVRLLSMLATAAVATGAYSVMRGDAATGPATIRITDRQVSYKRLGQGTGSRELAQSLLYSNKGQQIGDEAVLCTYLDRRRRLCSITFSLPKGTIVAVGALSSRLLYELAIVGGTDLYDTARGTLTSTSIGLKPRRDILLFRLTE